MVALRSLGLAHSMDKLVHFTQRLLTHRSLLVSFGPETLIIILIIPKETLLLPSEWLRPDRTGTDPNLTSACPICKAKHSSAQVSPDTSKI